MKHLFKSVPAPLKWGAMSVLLLGASIFSYVQIESFQYNQKERAIAQQKLDLLEEYAGWTQEDVKKNKAKYDRPDLASLQNYEMTMDPNLGYVPNNRRLAAYQETQKRLANKRAIQGVTWSERGPNNVGGRTRALMFDPNDGTAKKVWAGGAGGGLWYNTDITSSSTSWTAVDDFWANLTISCIAYDPSNTQNFYIGTGLGFAGYVGGPKGAGIWKSSNGGSSWTQLASTDNSTFEYVNRIGVTSNGTILAATSNGIQRSTNGGSSWTMVRSGDAADLKVGANGTIYASTGYLSQSGKVYKSTNDGSSWTDITPATGAARIELAVAPSNGNVLYAVSSKANDIGTVAWMYKSTNGGSSWSSITVPKYQSQSCSAAAEDFARGQAFYDLIIAVHPTNTNIVVLGGIDTYRTTNGGSSWSLTSYWTGSCKTYLHADQHSMQFRPGFNNEMILGNDGGVAYSSNMGSSSSPSIAIRNKGYNVTQFYAMDMTNTSGSNNMIAGAQDNGTQRYTSAGMNSTTEASGGDGAYCHIDQDNGNYQLSSYVYNSYYRSTNGGSSFTNILNVSNRGRFINPTDYDDDTNILYAAGNADEFIRVSGITGTVAANALAVSTGGRKVSAVTVSPYTANRIYLGTDQGKVYRVNNANGDSPSISTISTSSLPSGYINCIAVGSSDNQLMVTYTSYGVTSVWETRNGGSSWQNKEGNLPDMPIRWALYNPANTDEVLLATEVGVWSVEDVNVSSPAWEVTSTALANVRCDMLQYRDSDGTVGVATHGRGVFTSQPFSGTVTPPVGCTSSVSSFPYNQNFESAIGLTQDSGDDTDWTRQTGATGSSNTGPSAANQGSYYAYIEASSPNYPSKTANLVTPCLNTTGASNTTLTFDYHMYGADMGTLNVQIQLDGETTWTTAWTRSGDQTNSWNSATVDLNSYAGQTFKIRFNGVTGAGYTSDISIDDVSVSTAAAATCDVPTGLASSSVGQNGFTLTWAAVSGATSYDVKVGSNTYNTTTNSYTATGLTASTTYSSSVRTNCASGSSAYSASINTTTSAAPSGLTCTTTVSSFPYNEGFESGFGSWSQGSGDDFDWTRKTGSTASSNTGPASASGGSYYLYMESSSPNNSNDVAILNGPCFNLGSASSSTLTFKYHMYGASNMGNLKLQASTTDGSWTDIWSKAGNQGNSWETATVDMAAYVGSNVKLRFYGTTGSTWQGDMAIDDLSMTTGSTGGGTTAVTLTINFDNYASETSWTLKDSNGTTLHSGNGYADGDSGITENFDLPAGCYEFTISDSYGDGICCSYGNGSYTLVAGGTTEASGGAYGSGETTNFCVGGATTTPPTVTEITGGSENVTADAQYLPEFYSTVYPNPATSQISITIEGMKDAQYNLVDMFGRTISKGEIVEGKATLDLRNLSKGVYFIRVNDGTSTITEKFIKK